MKNRTWRAALYMRLSKEDERGGESASIENQRKILRAFCRENTFEVWDEYVDDGYSGTDAETRPALQRMLADIRAGRVNLVLCKDLSRLGRNIGDTANLLDKFFPMHRVRFISVTEGTDTEKRDRAQRILTPLHNFANELYAADISDKIHAALRMKIQNGEYIGSFAPFGYKKDPAARNHLMPDAVAAAVVREIFTLAAEGEKPADIAGQLNANAIKTPSMYRAEQYPPGEAFPKTERWTSGMVGKILRNRVYLGHTEQGKTEKPSFKCKVTYAVPRASWTVVENTHEPLISSALWEQVRLHMRSRHGKQKSGFQNRFSGIAVCADCGRYMSTAFSHGRVHLVCGGYKAGGKAKCTAHRISYVSLLETVQGMLAERGIDPENFRDGIEKIRIDKNGNAEIFIRQSPAG